jgi:signal transduction histidine kinase
VQALTSPLKVLLVEDSQADAELVLLELRRCGFRTEHRRVESSPAMAEALAAADWDLVLSDYRLPGYGGMVALEQVQASGHDIPFILVSGAIGEEVAVDALKAGAHGFVSKDNLGRLGPAVGRELKEALARQAQRRAKEELRLSEERYRTLFEHSPLPTSVQDLSAVRRMLVSYQEEADGDLRAFFRARPDELRRCAAAVRILEGNAARARFFRDQEREDAPRDLPAIFLEASYPVFLEELLALAGGATTFTGEIPLRAAAGEQRLVNLHLSVSPGHEGDLGRVLASFVDVTERNHLQAALRDLERLSAKGQMAAYIAHEINNPLAGIKNAFALLEPAIPADHPHRRYAGLIRREIDRIAGIIRTIYHVYRPQAPEPVDVPLREVFQDIQSLLLPKCRSQGAAIEVDLCPPDLKVTCNEGLLRQVVFNLAQNAVEASPRDGLVVLAGRAAGGGQVIEVQDQGPGIPPEWAERVFQPGFTSKGGSGMSGLGLGLSTCKNLAATMGGSLDFTRREPGPGCVFRVSLPARAGGGGSGPQ